jgi:hypothetical protein
MERRLVLAGVAGIADMLGIFGRSSGHIVKQVG